MDMLDAVTLDQFRTFIAAVDEGSFSAAGRKLRRAQSVVSQTLANLEAQLGVKLFDRSARLGGVSKPVLDRHCSIGVIGSLPLVPDELQSEPLLSIPFATPTAQRSIICSIFTHIDPTRACSAGLLFTDGRYTLRGK
jgi:hypothetical protein